MFFPRFNFVCWLLFSGRSILVWPQWHVKDPGHSAKSAAGRLQHAFTCGQMKSERADYADVQAQCGNLSGNIHTQLVMEHSASVVSARSATLNWSWHEEWREISMNELISTSKKKKKNAGGEWMVAHSFKTLSSVESHHHDTRVHFSQKWMLRYKV